MSSLRDLPSVDKLINSTLQKGWGNRLIHPIRVRLAQEFIESLKEELNTGQDLPSVSEMENRLGLRFESLERAGMTKVINATGIVLHTNLGRAPLGHDILNRMSQELAGYSALEFNLEKGERWNRTSTLEQQMVLLSGAEGCAVVNNNAAALFLILQTFSDNSEVILSRGEFVQIGGEFRVPDILKASGASIKEVGTTNITSLHDYQEAIGPQTSILLKVHQSNFVISGHTECPNIESLSKLAADYQKLFVMDLGTGFLTPRKSQFITELSVNDVIRMGVPLVCFSGDKLLGGAQAGFIVGELALIKKIKANPLFRALRLGKLEIFVLEEILRSYMTGEDPLTKRLLDIPTETLLTRAQTVQKKLNPSLNCEIHEGVAPVGGGTLPDFKLSTVRLELDLTDPEGYVKRLRLGKPPVVPLIENKRVKIDLRTVLPDEEDILVKQLLGAL